MHISMKALGAALTEVSIQLIIICKHWEIATFTFDITVVKIPSCSHSMSSFRRNPVYIYEANCLDLYNHSLINYQFRIFNAFFMFSLSALQIFK